MTLDGYAGLFGDDLDTVADLLDEAAQRAAADSMRTREATGRVLRSPRARDHAVTWGSVRAREENRTPDLRITSLVQSERTYVCGRKGPDGLWSRSAAVDAGRERPRDERAMAPGS